MSKLDNYDSTTERVDSASVEERFIKFSKIAKLIEKENITISDIGIGGHTVNLKDETCGFTLRHGIISWEIFRIVDVVDMIVGMRNDYIARKSEFESQS